MAKVVKVVKVATVWRRFIVIRWGHGGERCWEVGGGWERDRG